MSFFNRKKPTNQTNNAPVSPTTGTPNLKPTPNLAPNPPMLGNGPMPPSQKVGNMPPKPMSAPVPPTPRPMAPTPNFAPTPNNQNRPSSNVVINTPPTSSVNINNQPNLNPNLNAPKPMYSGPSFGPTPNSNGPSFGPSPSFGGGFQSTPVPSPSNNIEITRNTPTRKPYLDDDAQVEEILNINLSEGRVPKKHLTTNSPIDEIKAYVTALSNRKNELIVFEHILRQRLHEIEDMMRQKGIKIPPKKAAPTKKATSKKTKPSTPKQNLDKDKKEAAKPNKNINETKKPSTSANKEEKLKVMVHKKTVNTDHLGYVHHAKKPSTIVTVKSKPKKAKK